MSELTIKEIGALLARAVDLKTKPVYVYGSDKIPVNGKITSSISDCAAAAIYQVASGVQKGPIYVTYDQEHSICRCRGGPAWFGFAKIDPGMAEVMACEMKEISRPAPKYLKESEKAALDTFMSTGKIAGIGKYVVMATCEDARAGSEGRCIICFGTGAQIRDLCALAHFRRHDAFDGISVPWGASCGTLVTYPAGMSENAQGGRICIGPVDPSAREWMPADFMGIGIPIQAAGQMAADVHRSFISKRAR